MFIGHFAVGLAAKRWLPAVSLGTLFLAAQFVDVLWPALVQLGVENFEIEPGITAVTPLEFIHYPYSHSLLMGLVWALLFGTVYFVLRRGRIAVAAGLACVVFSHWLLDFASHRPDLPLAFGNSPMVGLGLWNSLVATIAVELLLFVAGVVLYLKTTRAKDRIGRYAFWGLVAFLLLVNAGNMFGPPPPSTAAVAWSAHAIWLLIAWGYWVDRHRISVGGGDNIAVRQ